MPLSCFTLAIFAAAPVSVEPPPPATDPTPAPLVAPADETDAALGRAEDTVLLLGLRPTGVAEREAAMVTALIAEVLAERSSLRVVTADDVNAMVQHQKTLQRLDCIGEACIAEMSRVANARLALSGSIGRVGAGVVVSLTLLDTERSEPRGSASRTVGSLDEVLGAVPALLAEVFGWDKDGGAPAARYALPEGRGVSFAVFDLAPQGLSEQVAVNLTQVLAGELKKVKGASVIGRDDIASLLALEAEKERMDCGDEMACLAEVGGALGVEKLVVGTVGKLGESYVISLRLIDVGAVRVDSRVNESLLGLEDQLIPAVRLAGRRLLGIEETGTGALALSGNEAEAEVVLDEAPVGLLPMPPRPDLVSGRHSLRLSKSGFFDWRSDFYIHPKETTVMWAELARKPVRWPFWTSAGATGAAGVAAIVLGAVAQVNHDRFVAESLHPSDADGAARRAAEVQGRDFTLACNALWIGTGVLAVTTGVVAFLTDWD